jgi:hypothetical protein
MQASYSKTLAAIVDDTLRICSDFRGVGRDGLRWSRRQVTAAVNDAALDLVAETGVLKDARTIRLRAGAGVYDLPPDCLRLLRVGIDGALGKVVLPSVLAQVDLDGGAASARGKPVEFFRELLAPDQIGVLPVPAEDGPGPVTGEGIVRQIRDADGRFIPFDAGRPLRRLRGVPFRRSGGPGVVREVISEAGNLHVNFVRYPRKLEAPDDLPDSEFPAHVPKELKYGAALRLLVGSGPPLHGIKRERFTDRWRDLASGLQRSLECRGPLEGAQPL